MKTIRTICDVKVSLGDGALRICDLIGDIEAEVHYDYEPGEREVLTLANGDPGEPGYPSDVSIDKVITTQECTLYGDGCKLVIEAGIDVLDMLTIDQIDSESGELLIEFEQELADCAGEAAIDRYESNRVHA